jgi:hypothetical protein
LEKQIKGAAMNKLTLKHNPIKNPVLFGYGIMLPLLSLAIAACVEQFAKMMFLLG